jgi:hypothetical protein
MDQWRFVLVAHPEVPVLRLLLCNRLLDRSRTEAQPDKRVWTSAAIFLEKFNQIPYQILRPFDDDIVKILSNDGSLKSPSVAPHSTVKLAIHSGAARKAGYYLPSLALSAGKRNTNTEPFAIS